MTDISPPPHPPKSLERLWNLTSIVKALYRGKLEGARNFTSSMRVLSWGNGMVILFCILTLNCNRRKEDITWKCSLQGRSRWTELSSLFMCSCGAIFCFWCFRVKSYPLPPPPPHTHTHPTPNQSQLCRVCMCEVCHECQCCLCVTDNVISDISVIKFLQWWHDVILPLWWSVTFTGFSNDLSVPLISCHQWSCISVTDDVSVPVMKICHFHWFQQWSVCTTDKLSSSMVMYQCDDVSVPVMKICHFHWFQQWSVCITDKLSLSVVMQQCNWWCVSSSDEDLSLSLVSAMICLHHW